MKFPRLRMPQLWTSPQQGVLIAALCVLLAYLVIRLILNPIYVSDPQPREPARFHDLADRIDPNDADWATLAALPNIGEKRAKEIVAYRERYVATNPGKRAFASADDLLRIKGFGFAIVTQLRPYLIFPQSNGPTTQNQSR